MPSATASRIGVVEDHHRRLAAQLEMHALQRVGCVARDQLPGVDVAGERDKPDVGVLDEPLAGRHAIAGHDLQHAVGDDVLRELDEAKQRQRRLLRRLEDLHVAGRERRPELPDRHHQRVVPRADAGDDADRLAPDHRRVALDVLAGRTCPRAVARRAREEAEVVGAEPISSRAGRSAACRRCATRSARAPRRSRRSRRRASAAARRARPGSRRAIRAARPSPPGRRCRRPRRAARHLRDLLAGRGLMTSIVAPETESVNVPPIRTWWLTSVLPFGSPPIRCAGSRSRGSAAGRARRG